MNWTSTWEEGEMDVLNELQQKKSKSSSSSLGTNDYIDDIQEPHEYVYDTDDTDCEDPSNDASCPRPLATSLKRKESSVPVYGQPSLRCAESAFQDEGGSDRGVFKDDKEDKRPREGVIWHVRLVSFVTSFRRALSKTITTTTTRSYPVSSVRG